MAGKVLIARQMFVAEIDRKTVVVIEGARFRATDPVVKANPSKFAEAGK